MELWSRGPFEPRRARARWRTGQSVEKRYWLRYFLCRGRGGEGRVMDVTEDTAFVGYLRFIVEMWRRRESEKREREESAPLRERRSMTHAILVTRGRDRRQDFFS